MLKLNQPEQKAIPAIVNEPQTGPEPDERWDRLVYNPDIERVFDAELDVEEKRLGRRLTGEEAGNIAHKYMG